MAQGTPDTTNAPSDLCERNQIPCITVNTPVEAWLFGPDGKPKTFKHTFHFFFGVPDLVINHVGMIRRFAGRLQRQHRLTRTTTRTARCSHRCSTRRSEGGLEADRPARFQQGLPDFNSIINQFKRNRVEVVTGVLAPPTRRTTCGRPRSRATSRRCTSSTRPPAIRSR